MSCEIVRALAKVAASGSKAVVLKWYFDNGTAVDVIVDGKPVFGASVEKPVLELASKALKEGRSLEATINGVRVVAELIETRPTIVVVGSGLVAKALVDVASAIGYYVVVVGNGDVNVNEFRGAHLVSNNLADLEELVGEGTIVIVANEGGKPYDAEALYLALKNKAKYVGLLASQKRAALMVAEMVKRGLEMEYVLSRLHSPVGLDLGARTAGEIALSILAEVVMYIRNGSGRPMREVKDPRKYLGDALRGDLQMSNCSWRPEK